MPRSKRTARKKAATKKAPPPSGRARKVMRHREMQDLGPSPPLYTPGPDDTIRKPDYGGDIVPLCAALPRMPPAHTGETGKLLKPVPPTKTKKRDGAYIYPANGEKVDLTSYRVDEEMFRRSFPPLPNVNVSRHVFTTGTSKSHTSYNKYSDGSPLTLQDVLLDHLSGLKRSATTMARKAEALRIEASILSALTNSLTSEQLQAYGGVPIFIHGVDKKGGTTSHGQKLHAVPEYLFCGFPVSGNKAVMEAVSNLNHLLASIAHECRLAPSGAWARVELPPAGQFLKMKHFPPPGARDAPSLITTGNEKDYRTPKEDNNKQPAAAASGVASAATTADVAADDEDAYAYGADI